MEEQARDRGRRLGDELNESDLAPNPIAQFEQWFGEAIARGLDVPNAMTLATATLDGAPSVRMVLLKGVDKRGFVFYTNYASRKGKELATNPRAALVFYWGELHRQVRVEGRVRKVPADESEAYFRTRPHESQLSAWASPQSAVIPNRRVLENDVQELRARYSDGRVPLPPFWGGYCVEPDVIEFWQGRQNRLHDRVRYTRSGIAWTVERLAP